MADSIKIPVDIELSDPNLDKALTNVANNFGRRLEEQFRRISEKVTSKQLPAAKPIVTGRETFSLGGKKYEIAGQIAPSGLVKEKDELGNIIQSYKIKTQLRIKEIRENVAKSLTIDERRLAEFRNSLKFQPIHIKRESLTAFLNESDKLKQSLSGLLPKDQLSAIRQFIKTSPTFSKTLSQDFLKNLDDFEKDISELSVIDQEKAISSYVTRFTDTTGELTHKLSQVEKSFQRKRFQEVRTKIRGLNPERASKILEDYAKSPGALVDETNAIIRQISEKFRLKIKTKHKTAFMEKKQEIAELPLEEREKEWQKYIDEGGKFSNRARSEIEKVRNKLAAKQYSEVREEASSVPIEQRAAIWQKYIDDGGKFSNRAKAQINRINTQLDRQSFSDKSLEIGLIPVLKDRVAAWQKYIDDGGKFANKAKREINRLNKQIQNEEYVTKKEEISLLPEKDRAAAWKQYIDNGGKFVNRAKIQIERWNNQAHHSKFIEKKLEINALPVEERAAAWQDYIDNGGKFVLRAKSEIAKLNTRIGKDKFTTEKHRIAEMPLEAREAAWRQFESQNKKFSSEINKEVNRIRSQLSRKQFSEFKKQTKLLPVDERIKAWQMWIDKGDQFADQARIELSKDIKVMSKQRFAMKKKQIAMLPLDQQQRAWQAFTDELNDEIIRVNRAFRTPNVRTNVRNILPSGLDVDLLSQSDVKTLINSNRDVISQVNDQTRKVRDRLHRVSYSEVLSMNIGLPIQDQIRNLEDYINQGGKYANKARDKIEKLTKQSKRTRFSEFKESISHLSLDDQITAWNGFLTTNADLTDKVNKEIQKLTKNINTISQTSKRNLFKKWTKNLQTMPLETALEQLDTFIAGASPNNQFLNEATILRNRMRRSLEQQRRRAEQERNLRNRNMVMLGAGAGLGLLGPAGFPLLNVGFAAMSGNIPGAALVGFTTALGESIRALERFSDANMNAAKESGFIARELKLAEVRERGIRSVYTAREQAGKIEELRVVNDIRMRGVRSSAGYFSSLWADIVSSYKRQWAGNLDKGFFSEETNWWKIFKEQRKASLEGEPRVLEDARREMIRQLNKGNYRIETNPYETWKRMQEAAFNPAVEDERLARRELIKAINETTEELKKINGRANTRMSKEEVDRSFNPLWGV